jgi:hypothetical protein
MDDELHLVQSEKLVWKVVWVVQDDIHHQKVVVPFEVKEVDLEEQVFLVLKNLKIFVLLILRKVSFVAVHLEALEEVVQNYNVHDLL